SFKNKENKSKNGKKKVGHHFEKFHFANHKNASINTVNSDNNLITLLNAHNHYQEMEYQLCFLQTILFQLNKRIS
ncbi:hypothetical protein Mgra_00001281, partial [Meloidogyne graminicola]